MKEFVDASAAEKAEKLNRAKAEGILVECGCCGDDQFLAEDMFPW